MALTTDQLSYGTYAALTVTNLNSLANDATDPFAGWQSIRLDFQGAATKPLDVEILIDIGTANTAPANDAAAYVYLVPWMTTDGGTTWIPGGSFGTTTAPAGAEGTASASDPNSMKGPIAIPYKIAQQRLQTLFFVAALCGGTLPDGASLYIRNCTGAAFLGSGNTVAYRPINVTNS